MILKYLYVDVIFYLLYQMNQCKSTTIAYISTERPVVNWYDKTFLRNVTIHSKRLNRRDPKHYVELYFYTLVTVTNNVKLDYYFYQLLTNRYKPSFVEMHYKLCDLVDSDTFFGQSIRNSLRGQACPFPPGEYHLKNLSIGYVPKSFPFTHGRIYLNASLTEGGVTRQVLRMSCDMEVKMYKINKN